MSISLNRDQYDICKTFFSCILAMNDFGGEEEGEEEINGEKKDEENNG